MLHTNHIINSPPKQVEPDVCAYQVPGPTEEMIDSVLNPPQFPNENGNPNDPHMNGHFGTSPPPTREEVIDTGIDMAIVGLSGGTVGAIGGGFQAARAGGSILAGMRAGAVNGVVEAAIAKAFADLFSLCAGLFGPEAETEKKKQ